MLVPFFLHLKHSGLPVSLKEYLDLLNALEKQIAKASIDDFYALSRMMLIKDERYYDKFDVAFSQYINGETLLSPLHNKTIPQEWLAKMIEKHLSEEEKKAIKSLGDFNKLMETFKKRLEEQKGRHQGGNKWIGTGGTSPFGAYGYHPEGFRLGQEGSRHQRAVKVWDKREFYNLDEDQSLQRRNMAMALRRLKQFSRVGVAEELDLDATIKETANKAGLLSLKMVPEKKNNVKVLLLFDIGGSMDSHVYLSQELFNEAKRSFKQMDYFYFHNCVYETVWQDNSRRRHSSINTLDLFKRFNQEEKVIFVGDAAMSPYELTMPGGSVEHMNLESGEVWLKRLLDYFPKCVWLNPIPQEHWVAQSIDMVKQMLDGRMYPLTIDGVTKAMGTLS